MLLLRGDRQETMSIQINGFEVIEKLGQGGMASVWKARQVSLDRTVAIKVLSDRLALAPEDVRRFQEEAQSAAKLKHPGIVQVHDAAAENGVYYFIMEYVAGYTVGDWVRRKGVLSEQDALLVAECVADALSYAWDRAGIIHCDIKPDNLIIDEDGTVKVADLGLARTISAMGGDAEAPTEIMGTPAYISPEQAQGDPNLDFRADIYSLGAMLYHLVTGKMMFEGCDEDEVLDKQISDTVADPLEVNPALSKAVCWLIERMTAKDPAMREGSWEAVKQDILKVRRGLLPTGKVLPDGASTVRRSDRRNVSDYQRVVRLQKAAQAASTPSVRTALMAAFVAVAIAVALRLYMIQSQPELPPVLLPGEVVTNVVTVTETEPGPVLPEPLDPLEEDDDQAREMYEFAEAWHMENPSDLGGSIAQFEAVKRETRGTKYTLMAQNRIRELSDLREESIRATVNALRQETQPLVAAGRFDDAMRLVALYRGPFADETTDMRRKALLRLKAEKDAWAEERRQEAEKLEQHRQSRTDELTMSILSDDLARAIELVAEMLQDDAFADQMSVLEEARDVLTKADEIGDRIMDSFRSQRGDTIEVQLTSGIRTLTIGAVVGDKVSCRQMLSVGRGAMSTIHVGVADLSPREQLLRMGPDELPEVALAKGIMAFQSRAYTHAEKYFGMTHPFLAEQLLRRLHGEADDPGDEYADEID
jgi:serine/threonine protein kinase